MPAVSRIAALTMLIAGSVAMTACASKAPKQLPPDPGPATTTEAGPSGPVPGSQADFAAFYFDTDRYNIDSVDASALQTQAQWLQRYPQKRATLEGHADERGTRDYNLALGERRANSAKNYLVSLGIDANRLNTISYGKERPIALGSDESSWARNRRAVTVTVD
jgi:peptidoglycan-associated lipoprotein